MNVPLILAPAMGQQHVITQMEVTGVCVSKVIQEMVSNAHIMLVKYLILILYYFLALTNTVLLKNRLIKHQAATDTTFSANSGRSRSNALMCQ